MEDDEIKNIEIENEPEEVLNKDTEEDKELLGDSELFEDINKEQLDNEKIKEEQISIDISKDNEQEDDIEEEESEDEPIEEDSEQIKLLKEKVDELDKTIAEVKFARVETKPEFASEVINNLDNQKTSNLEEYQIMELLEKRKFFNLLVNFGWDRLATRVIKNVKDVENYALSNEGFLMERVFTDSTKQKVYNYDENKKPEGISKYIK